MVQPAEVLLARQESAERWTPAFAGVTEKRAGVTDLECDEERSKRNATECLTMIMI